MDTTDSIISAIEHLDAQLDTLIGEALDHQNNATTDSGKKLWENVGLDLQDKQQQLQLAKLNLQIQDAQPALDALRGLTQQLTETASHMQSATAFINTLNQVLGAANTAISLAQQAGGQ